MKHCFCFEKIVIGGNLDALSYSYKNNLPLVINKLCSPYRFEPEKKALWNKLYFMLSLSGLNILGDKTDNIRIDKEELMITTKDSKVIKIKYDKLVLFDDRSISGLPLPSKKTEEFIVLDWMDAENCMMHNHEKINTNDNFVKKIYFYPTDRIFGNHTTKKDLIVVSRLTKKQLQDFRYSDTMARFKTEKMLKNIGITGRKNGFTGGKQINYSLKLKVKKREVRRLKMHLYENTENIEFNYSTVEEEIKKTDTGYINKLENIFND